MRPCTVEGCGREAHSRGWCHRHYGRWYTRGSVDAPLSRRPSVRRGSSLGERLSETGWTVTESGCWEWLGYKDRDGYGRLSVDGRGRSAHRVSYEHFVGPIPEGMVVRHKCDNPPCINPDHLELGTHRDNMEDRAERATGARGERHGQAKLCDMQVREIYLSSLPDKTLAREYGVDPKTIHNIRTKRRWLHVTNTLD